MNAERANIKREIWVIEDEEKIARLLSDYLIAHGFTTRLFFEGGQVVEAVRKEPPHLLLLDLNLPGKDGMDICREIRGFSQVPIIFVTARIEEIDRLLGLELGGDDYICKPFSPREVVARVKAVLRRTGTVQTEEKALFVIEDAAMKISIKGQSLDLTPNEFHLLKAFIQQAGRVFSRDQLIDQMYDDMRAVTDRTVDTHIKNIRKKIAQSIPDQQVIHSVYGVGYKFELQDQED